MLRRILNGGRYLLVLPIIGSLILTVAVLVMGVGLIVRRGWQLFREGEFSDIAAKSLSVTVIETIDLFLVGAISYITAVGLYKLFISQKDEQILKRVKIESLVDLENKIIGVVVAALAVAFLGYAADATDAKTVFHTGVGIALVIAALCAFTKFNGASEVPTSNDERI